MSQLSSRLQESEREAMEKVSDLEKKLIQTTKEVELLKVEFAVLLVKTDLGSLATLWPAGCICYVIVHPTIPPDRLFVASVCFHL